MKYVLHFGIFLTFAILFTTSSGILKAEAYSDYQTDRNYKDNIYRYADENLLEIDKEYIKDLLKIFDQDMLLDTSIKLLAALNNDIINQQLLE